jgi:hypothetical protein
MMQPGWYPGPTIPGVGGIVDGDSRNGSHGEDGDLGYHNRLVIVFVCYFLTALFIINLLSNTAFISLKENA